MKSLSRSLPIYICLIIGIIWLIFSFQFLNQGIFWDLGIYEKAILIHNSGGNAYDTSQYRSSASGGIGHLFVYQPLMLRALAFLGPLAWVVLLFLYAASLLLFFQSIRKNNSWWLASFFAFTYCGLGTVAIGSGNVTTFLHLTLISLLLRNITAIKNKFIYFMALVVIFSLIKPYFIAYLLIPIVITYQTSQMKKVWFSTFFSATIFAAIFTFSFLYFGEEFKAFMTAVKVQTIDKHDLGHGILMYFYEYYRSAGALIYRAYVLHFAILGGLILLVLLFGKRLHLINKPNFALLLYFLLTILNPRLKVYDLFPAILTLLLFYSTLPQSALSRVLLAVAYTLSLSQLTNTPLFAHRGILSDPLNVYYLTLGLILIGTFFSLKNGFGPTLKK